MSRERKSTWQIKWHKPLTRIESGYRVPEYSMCFLYFYHLPYICNYFKIILKK